MAEGKKYRKAPAQNGAYGQGTSAGTRSTITKRYAKNPGQGRMVAPATNQPNNPANRRRK